MPGRARSGISRFCQRMLGAGRREGWPASGMPRRERGMVGDSERDKASERARLTLVLPLPPSVNHQYVTAGRRRVLSREAQSFRRDVAKTVQRLREVGKITP